MKKILVVSNCSRRGTSSGLTGKFLDQLSKVDNRKFSISLLDISTGNDNSQLNYPVESHFKLPKGIIWNFISKIPKIRSWHASNLAIKTYKDLLKQRKFVGVILYQVQPNADEWTRIAHENNAKIMFVPWGSEVLRASDKVKKNLHQAFAEVDFVIGALDANTLISAKEEFNVSDHKILQYKNYLKGVKLISEYQGKKTRKDMISSLGLPYSDCNILCGYNGYVGQRHKIIIDALSQVRSKLPKDYQLVFPITYGASQGYVDELRTLCEKKELKANFITNYLTDEQVAYLHLITDLFIQIQPTDDGNDFTKEALYARNEIITGKWLNYIQFEKYGTPYHLINRLEELPIVLFKYFTGEEPKAIIPQKLIEEMNSASSDDNKLFWENVFSKL